MQQGQVFVLLGHNGAGKTTLVNMLNRKISPSSGNASIMGHSLSHDVSSIQKLVGSVPQHDLLWNELSAYEHVRMFGAIKNIGAANRGGLDAAVKKILANVHLQDSASIVAGSYSGGMKRRLSIALSGIGNPAILFMDEPTTGIDLMQEAENLGDYVAIMEKGRIRAERTPLNLHSNYGTGYTLNFVAEFSKIPCVREMMQETIPSSTIINSSAGSLSIGVPKEHAEKIPELSKKLEAESLNREWNVTQSNREEVILRLVQTPVAATASMRAVAPVEERAGEAQGNIQNAEHSGEGDTERGESTVASHFHVQFTNAKIWSQFSSILYKLLLLQSRSPLSLLFMLAIPAALMAILKMQLFKGNKPEYKEVEVWPIAFVNVDQFDPYSSLGECDFSFKMANKGSRSPVLSLTTADSVKDFLQLVPYPAETNGRVKVHFDVDGVPSSVSQTELVERVREAAEAVLKDRGPERPSQGRCRLFGTEGEPRSTCGACRLSNIQVDKSTNATLAAVCIDCEK